MTMLKASRGLLVVFMVIGTVVLAYWQWELIFLLQSSWSMVEKMNTRDARIRDFFSSSSSSSTKTTTTSRSRSIRTKNKFQQSQGLKGKQLLNNNNNNNIQQYLNQSDYLFVERLVSRILELSRRTTTNATRTNHSNNEWLLFLAAHNKNKKRKEEGDTRSRSSRCALNFHGLPRAFRSVVLPSIIRYILIPNAHFQCDIFVFVHQRTTAEGGHGRSGSGGSVLVDPTAIYLLEHAARLVYDRAAGNNNKTNGVVIRIQTFTDDEFYQKRNEFLHRIYTEVDASTGKSLYLPWRAAAFTNETLINIARMWHGISGAWDLLEQTRQELHINYTRVGIFRSDVFFSTPISIFHIPPLPSLPSSSQTPILPSNSNTSSSSFSSWDWENKVAVIPGFARFPVNDRMMYGPYEAVKVYATERFERVHAHVRKASVLGKQKNGMHSENMLYKTIFPVITKTLKLEVRQDDDICFVRARADETLWLSDCDKGRPRPATIVDKKNHIWLENVVLEHARETLAPLECTKEKVHIVKVGVITQGSCGGVTAAAAAPAVTAITGFQKDGIQ